MSALAPGLYRATVRGLADQIVMVNLYGGGCTIPTIEGTCGHPSSTITDARPLIVLDLDTAEREYIGDLRYVADRLPEHNVHRALVHEIADQIEAQTKPARIPEPEHIGSLVMASTTFRDGISVWTKFSEVGSVQWINPSGSLRQWSELIDPEPFPFGGKR